jgi:hypothetical protein
MNTQEAILQLLVAAAPAVILYFTGWSYLYFYLNLFHININEINPDLPTIFIYSYPPLHALWLSHGIMIIVVVVLIAMLWVWGKRGWRHIGATWPNAWIAKEGNAVFERIADLPATAWTLVMLIFLVFVLPFPLKSLTAGAAFRAAERVWDEKAPELIPAIEPSSALELTPERLGFVALWLGKPKKSGEPNGPDKTQLVKDFSECAKRGGFGLIFSVEAHYYLLCRPENVKTTGTVFEVKGKEGLISVRYADRSKR